MSAQGRRTDGPPLSPQVGTGRTTYARLHLQRTTVIEPGNYESRVAKLGPALGTKYIVLSTKSQAPSAKLFVPPREQLYEVQSAKCFVRSVECEGLVLRTAGDSGIVSRETGE